MIKIPLSIAKYAHTLWMSELVLTYLHVDEEGILVSWGGYPRHYGLGELKTDMPVVEQVYVLEGLLPVTHTQIVEFISMGNGRVAHIHLLPFHKGTWVLMLDATEEHDRQQRLQQQANELSILTYRQSRLLQELENIRRNLEHEKNQLQQANEQKTRFIASLSHELRAPLASIMGYTKLLNDAQETAPQNNDYLSAVENNANHLIRLVDDILEQAKLDIGNIQLKPIACNLSELINNLRQLFLPVAKEKHLDFQIVTRENSFLPSVLIDEIRLRQVFINLINNALKFTAQGYVHVTVEWREDQLSFTIEDSGVGISEEGLKKLFTAFYRDKTTENQAGTGLGLSISQKIVQLMNGNIGVNSVEGKGATFKVIVRAPRVWQAELLTIQRDTRQHPTSPVKSIQNKQEKLLLAEDTEVLRLLFKLILHEHYQLIMANNGEEAVRLAFVEKPDIVLMDLQMPVMNGYDAIKQLRAEGFHAPIIALSASNFEEDRNYAMQLGCNAYLTKPVDNQRLLNTITQVLAQHSIVTQV
ncbi:signal transduction histidine kinase [Beggiatoa alba B18LD]|uniref:histidine kinase n=1 Tax=Beggiatoa alba B18LD TaxID=395493 RepID=I3CBH6_9GAMM|nr:ATP-binding protein [Beggiatoa alba]EIJ40969.1 signal transduction histidine kinase [Beggiatoa alba B18LD]